MPQAKPLRFWVELSLGEHVSGRVVDENGDGHVFAGWLAFFSLIDRLDAGGREGERAATDSPCRGTPNG